MSNFNRLYNITNPAQGKYKKVLCVCSAGLLRSPTAALVLSQEPYNFNTRAVGLISDYALIPIDDVLLKWADEIICMTEEQKQLLTALTKKRIISLGIPDDYEYRDPMLVELIKEGYRKYGPKSY